MVHALASPCREMHSHGLKWLLSRMKEDGTFDCQQPLELCCYYKAPYALLMNGELTAANRMLNFVRDTFLATNGDFAGTPERTEQEWFEPEYCYPNGWLIMGAHLAGRFDISEPGLKFILDYQNPRTGGFFATKGTENYGACESTVSIPHFGHTCLSCGRVAQARQAGEALLGILQVQPDLDSIFYARTDPEGLPIKQWQESQELDYRVDLTQPQQFYFYIGYPLAFLALLYRATAEERFLQGARDYFEVAQRCAADRWRFPAACKGAFGSALLYEITGKGEYLDTAAEFTQAMTELATAEGFWHYKQFFPDLADQPDMVTYDLAAEFVVWFSHILVALEL